MGAEVLLDAASAVQQVLSRPVMLSVAYQPIVDMSSSEVAAYEVLARLPGP